MFNIGGGELLVIMLIALIVLGPQRLPDAARQIGKTMGDLRRISTGFQNEMKSALDVVDDPTRVAARRNVLAKEGPPAPGSVVGDRLTPAADAIAVVGTPPAPSKSARSNAAKRKAVPAKAGATKSTTAKKAAATKRTTAQKTATSRATPAKKAATGSTRAGTTAKKAASPAGTKATRRRTAT